MVWGYIVCIAICVGIIFGWLIPVIRKHIVYEIYEACGLGRFFSLLTLNLSGVWTPYDILALKIIGFILHLPVIFCVSLAFIALRIGRRACYLLPRLTSFGGGEVIDDHS